MIGVIEHNKEKVLLKRIDELEIKLIQNQKEILEVTAYNKHLEDLLKGYQATKQSRTITIKSATKIEFIKVKDIVCCHADMNYTDIQLLNGRIITATKPLAKFDELLTDFSFFRISKSHLVNLKCVKTFYKDKNEILLQGETILKVARRKRVDFLKIYN